VICRTLNVARSTAYYREHERIAVVDEVLAQRAKHLIDAELYLGYRMVSARLRQQGFQVNRKAIQRLMQLKGRSAIAGSKSAARRELIRAQASL
jgi:hypothetical protein